MRLSLLMLCNAKNPFVQCQQFKTAIAIICHDCADWCCYNRWLLSLFEEGNCLDDCALLLSDGVSHATFYRFICIFFVLKNQFVFMACIGVRETVRSLLNNFKERICNTVI